MKLKIPALSAVLCSLALLLVSNAAQAQQAAWPTKSVRWIVPFGAGGAADAVARTLAQKLSEKWASRCWWITGLAATR